MRDNGKGEIKVKCPTYDMTEYIISLTWLVELSFMEVRRKLEVEWVWVIKCFEHVTFEMTMKHPCRDVILAIRLFLPLTALFQSPDMCNRIATRQME